MCDGKRFVEKKQLDFDVLKTYIKMVLSKKSSLTKIDFEINENYEKLNTYIQKEYICKQENFHKTHIPKTWKDHFKHKYRARRWLRWWIKRKPIQYHKISRITIFPEVPVPQGEGFETKISYLEYY